MQERRRPESLRLEFSEKLSSNKFALLNTKDINPGPLYSGSSSFWEVRRLFCFISVNKVQELFCNDYEPVWT